MNAAEWAGLGASLIVVMGGSGAVLRGLHRLDRKFSQFAEDWNGTPARPGVPARAGVMERLSLIELAQVDNRSELDGVKTRLNRKGL